MHVSLEIPTSTGYHARQYNKPVLNKANMNTDDFETAVAEFVWAVEEVFHRDWAYTESMFQEVGDGTFLEPHVEDEAEDWGNRAFFLERFRILRSIMKKLGIQPISPFHPPNSR
jgi:hypothetical protein